MNYGTCLDCKTVITEDNKFGIFCRPCGLRRYGAGSGWLDDVEEVAELEEAAGTPRYEGMEKRYE